MINTHALGMQGEQLAYEYLKEKGYKILERNYRNKTGEIDIIAKKNNRIIFVEVKQKSSLKFGYPREMITSQKIKKIRDTAIMYLQSHKLIGNQIQFDCIEIIDKKITHIENCF